MQYNTAYLIQMIVSYAEGRAGLGIMRASLCLDGAGAGSSLVVTCMLSHSQ